MHAHPQNTSVAPEAFPIGIPHTSHMQDALAAAAELISEPARAAMLLRLMSGRALPAGELALAANVSPQTASGHLARLVEAHFLSVEQQGRHRYFRLAGTDIASAVEALLVLTPAARRRAAQPSAMPEAGTLAHARTCYAHLAGWLGVRIADALQARGILLPASGKAFALTPSGRDFFGELGVSLPPVPAAPSAAFARQCLDWTERRPHLAGAVGVALYRRLLALGWIAPAKGTRTVRVTLSGKQELWKRLRIAVA